MKYRCSLCGRVVAPTSLLTCAKRIFYVGEYTGKGKPFCATHDVESRDADGSLSLAGFRSLSRSLREKRPAYALKAAAAAAVRGE